MIQKSLINKSSISLKEAKDLLRREGYVIIKEDNSSNKLISDLITYFYTQLNKLQDKLGYTSIVSTNNKNDIKVLKKFLNNNIKLGLSKKDSIDNLTTLFDLFFKYYSELKLTQPITNIKFLLTDGYWILDKIKYIHKKKLEEYRNSFEMEQWFNGLCDEEDDIIRKLRSERHKELLGEQNGKKERKD